MRTPHARFTQLSGRLLRRDFTSALGQTWKIRASPLHVRFTPLSGRMLRRVPNVCVGPYPDVPLMRVPGAERCYQPLQFA